MYTFTNMYNGTNMYNCTNIPTCTIAPNALTVSRWCCETSAIAAHGGPNFYSLEDHMALWPVEVCFSFTAKAIANKFK